MDRSKDKPDWLGMKAKDLPARLRAIVLKWFTNVPDFRPSGFDVVERLKSDVSGMHVHPGYYKLDLLDAANEIERLRAELARARPDLVPLAKNTTVIFWRWPVVGKIIKGPENYAGSNDMYLVQTAKEKEEWVHRSQLKTQP